MSSTTSELCERAIDGWKKTHDTFVNELIPAQVFFAFTLGSMTKEKRKKVQKESPEIFEKMMFNIKKGQELMLGTNCKKCNKRLNVNDNFCPKCGMKFE